MDRPVSRPRRYALCTLTLLAAAPLAIGCHPGLLLATGVYFWEGGNFVDPECEALVEKRVVVFCPPPAATEFRHAGASRQIARRVGALLRENVEDIDLVDQAKVDEWLDENDSEDFRQLGQAVKSDLVVRVELGHFDLYSGPTVYQGNADVTLYVHDMDDDGKVLWEKPLGEVLYPVHGGVPVQDKPVSTFQREYIEVLASQVARHFYKHDPYADFAIDALANR